MIVTYPEAIAKLMSLPQGRRIAILDGRTPHSKEIVSDVVLALVPDFEVVVVGQDFIHSYEAMATCAPDVVMALHCEELSELGFLCLRKYSERGGNLILAANDWFFADRGVNGAERLKDGVLNAPLEVNSAYFNRTTAILGIKPYRSDVAPTQARVDLGLMGEGDEEIASWHSPAGVCIATSTSRHVPAPRHGSTFPERYVVQRSHVAVGGVDPAGRVLTAGVVFCENWEDGSRKVVIADNSVLSSTTMDGAELARLMGSALRFCSHRASITRLSTNFACYRQGEPVTVTCEVAAYGPPRHLALEVEVRSDGGRIEVRSFQITPAQADRLNLFVLDPSSFSGRGDYFEVKATLRADGQVVSAAENAFVIWHDEVAQSGPTFEVSDGRLLLDGKDEILVGLNYYEFSLGELMWVTPNVRNLKSDLEEMQRWGVRYMRMHFHHAKWFKDYLSQSLGFVPDYYAHIDDSDQPSERTLRIFDAHVYLCQKYGIVFCPDLFTLVPTEMGDPRGWINVSDHLSVAQKREAQLQFLRTIVPRYARVKGLSWDIFNEPHHAEIPDFHDRVIEWASALKAEIRRLGDTRVVTVGAFDGEAYIGRPGSDELMDYHSIHTTPAYAKRPVIQSKLFMVQELWVSDHVSPDGERRQAEMLAEGFGTVVDTGARGIVPWQWTNQSRLWGDHSARRQEVVDDIHGLCVRGDGTVKPAGRVFRRLVHALREGSLDRGLQAVTRQPTHVEGGWTIWTRDPAASLWCHFSADQKSLYCVADRACDLQIQVLGDHALKLELTDGWQALAVRPEHEIDGDTVRLRFEDWHRSYLLVVRR